MQPRRYHIVGVSPYGVSADFVVRAGDGNRAADRLLGAMDLEEAETIPWVLTQPVTGPVIVNRQRGLLYVQPEYDIGNARLSMQAWIKPSGSPVATMRAQWRRDGTMESLRVTLMDALDLWTKKNDLVVTESHVHLLKNGAFVR